jgi:hypothetical protein
LRRWSRQWFSSEHFNGILEADILHPHYEADFIAARLATKAMPFLLLRVNAKTRMVVIVEWA